MSLNPFSNPRILGATGYPKPPQQTPAGSEPDPAPESTPPAEDQTATRRGRLSSAEVSELRYRYRQLRDMAWTAQSAGEWRSTTQTEEQLAEEYGVSRLTVNKIVLGLSYPLAPGPLDLSRRAAHEQYLEDSRVLGAKAANSRARESLGEYSPYVLVTIIREDGQEETAVYPQGTAIRVETITPHRRGVNRDMARPDSDPSTDLSARP